jgi:hypothetical protein
MLTTDALNELAGDLIRRAEACERLAQGHRAAAKNAGTDLVETWEAETAEVRVLGKADAYRHAAELLRAAATTGDPVAKERESCAKCCDEAAESYRRYDFSDDARPMERAARSLAEDIRARGEVR